MNSRYSGPSVQAMGCFVVVTLLLRTATAQDTFEVASVKPADPYNNPIVAFSAYPGGRVIVTNQTLKMLISNAYGVPQHRIRGGPPWVDDNMYDITAKAPGGSPAAAFMPPKGRAHAFPSAELLGMVQTLLADRFNLKLHRETRQLPVLVLVVGKGGAKVQPARDPSREPVWPLPNQGNEYRSITMRWLVARLEAIYQRTIVDGTGLTGTYDFNLSYDRNLRVADDNIDFPVDPTRISLRTALETQVGLKLQGTKAPVEILVIDEAKKPSAN